jgi:hypothetical protein
MTRFRIVAAGILAICVAALSAEAAYAEDIGKRVRVDLRSGEQVTGVLRSDADDAVEIEVDDQGVLRIDASRIKKLVILLDQKSYFVEREKPAAPTGPVATHRLTPIALAFGARHGIGFELVGYEYIAKSGSAVRVTPLSVYGWYEEQEWSYSVTYSPGYSYTYKEYADRTAAYWTPIWYRYYLRKRPAGLWPYVGGTVAYHAFEDDMAGIERKTGLRPVLDYGIDFGGKTLRGFVGAKTFFGFGGTDKVSTLINAGISIGWKAE